MKKYLFIFSFILVFFGLFDISNASLPYQFDYSTSSSFNGTAGQTLGTGLSGVFNTLYLRTYQQPSLGNNFYRIFICSGTATTSFDNVDQPTDCSSLVYNSDQVNVGNIDIGSSTGIAVRFVLDNNLEFDPTKYYYLGYNTGFNSAFWGSPTTNSYLNGQLFLANPPTQIGNLKDAWFNFNNEIAGQSEVSFNFPETGIFVYDFENWNINYRFANNINASGSLSIFWKNGAFSENGLSWTDMQVIDGNVTSTNVLVPKLLSMPAGDYVASVSILNKSGVSLGTDQISFWVSASSSPPLFSSTSIGEAFSLASSTCNNYGFVGNAGCEIITFIFVPHNFSLDFFRSSLSTFQSAFPFSLFFQYTTSIQNASETAGSDSSSDLTFDFPAPWGSIKILSSSTLEQAFGLEAKNTIFDAIKTVIWIGAGLTAIITLAI